VTDEPEGSEAKAPAGTPAPGVYVFVDGKPVLKDSPEAVQASAAPASWRRNSDMQALSASPQFRAMLDQRSGIGLKFGALVENEMERVMQLDLSREKKIALISALSLMVASGRAERIYGIQVYMHLTGQELPPTKGARTLAAKSAEAAKAQAARLEAAAAKPGGEAAY
jgi:hypothetical protein